MSSDGNPAQRNPEIAGTVILLPTHVIIIVQAYDSIRVTSGSLFIFSFHVFTGVGHF